MVERPSAPVHTRSPQAAFQLGYIPALDGVRAIAVLAVLFFHVLGAHLSAVSPLLEVRGGFLGVDVFFVLSGFLITTILAQEFQARGTIDLRAFWVRRILRLMPALVVVLLGLLMLGLAVDAGLLHRGQGITTPLPPAPANQPWPFSPLPYWQGIFVVLLPVSNVVMLSHHNFYPMTNAWTLATEDQFYLLWPLMLLLLATRCRSLKKVLATAGVAALIFSVWRLFLLYVVPGTSTISLSHIYEVYFRPDARVAQLLAGCALGLAVVTGFFPQTLVAKRVVDALGWVGALAILGLFVFGGINDAWMHGVGFIVVTLATVAVLLHLVVAPSSLMSRTLSWPILVGVGQVSYGIYLWQVAWIRYAPGDGLAWAGAVIALTAVCALLSWVFIEQPALRLKRRYERRGDAPVMENNRSSFMRSGWPWLSRRHLTPLAGCAVMALIIAPALIAAEPYRADYVARVTAESEAAAATYQAAEAVAAEEEAARAAAAKQAARSAKAKKRDEQRVERGRPVADREKDRSRQSRATQERADGK
jgi:peptidoglycan/LPS O-acetylase OafA/YrhL